MEKYALTGQPNEYIDCYYTRSLSENATYPKLESDITTPVCIIGGGLAGISTALGLAERGIKATILESNRIGWGASGRNGGFVSAGYSQCPMELVNKLGKDHAIKLYKISKNAMSKIHIRVKESKENLSPPAKGVSVISWFNDQDAVKKYVDNMNSTFDANYKFWDRSLVNDYYLTSRYYDGYLKEDSIQIHSLKYARHTARLATNLGTKIFEKSKAVKIRRTTEGWKIETESGSVTAEKIVYCCSGYIGNLNTKLSNATLPVATYVLLTEPLGDRLNDCMRVSYATSDNRTSSNYYRPLQDGRLLWGGRVSMFHPSQEKLKGIMMKDLLHVYPQLKGIKAEVAWGGYMGYARHKMPQIGMLEPNAWYCQGFGGHGMCATTAGGETLAAAITEENEDYKLFEPFGLDYAGKPFGPAVAQIAYWYYQSKDKFNEWRLN